MIVIDLLIILAAAAIVAIVMQRARLAVIPAYLLAGALIGPSALGAVTSPDSLDAISRLAIILLMFGIGMELNLSSLRRGLGSMVGIGVVSCVFSILIAWPLLVMCGLTSTGAIAIGMALSTSSTAVVLRVLTERRQMHRTHGRICFAVSAVQDFLVLAMLASLPWLARLAGLGAESADKAGGGGATGFFVTAATMIGGLAALIVAGQLLVPRLMHEAARVQSGEVVLVLSTAFAIGAAVATQGLGFSAELGAFIAGYVLSATPFRHQISGQIGPLRDLFLAVFFTTVGMNLDPTTLAQWWWLAIVGVAALIVLKGAATGLTAWVFGTGAPVAVVVGLSLAGGSEISLVLLGAARSYGLIGDVTLANAIAVVVLSLILTPMVMGWSHRIAPAARKAPSAPWFKRPIRVTVETPEEADEEAREAAEAARQRGGRVVLAGYGVVGRAVAEKLKEMGLEYTIVELNPSTVRTQSELGIPIVYGDVSNREVLESAGVRAADVVVLAIPDDEAVLRACEVVRALAPDTFIAARTSFLSKGMAATRLGADHVTVEEMATAEAMAREVAKRIADKRDSFKKPEPSS